MSNQPNGYPADSHGEQRPKSPDHEQPGALSREQLLRLAEVIAAGEADFPVDRDVSPYQQQVLIDEVRRFRRARIVSFFARQIALRLHRQERNTDGRATGA